MSDFQRLLLDLAALVVGYWLLDQVVRQSALRPALDRLGARQSWAHALIWVLPGSLAAPFLSWHQVAEGPVLRVLATTLLAALSWRAATRDIDVVWNEAHALPRWLLLPCVIGSYFSPALVVSGTLLLSAPFEMWQHHAALPMRMLQALSAFVLLTALPWPPPFLQGAEALVLFVVTLQLSHYLITALAKTFLGPRWYSWVVDNRLHHIAASAYSWGWARFVPWHRWRRVIEATRRVERPMQIAVFAIELLAPLALWSPAASIGFSTAWALFHLGVFALSGLLFWEWIVTDLALAYTVSHLSPATQSSAFGPLSLLVGAVLLATFPLRHKLWKPMPLGWWDTPFTQRMHWRVRGESGCWYGLYANFMDPHERIYGKTHGCFMAPVPVLTYHLGEAFRHELRDGLRASQADPRRIEALRAEFGIQPRSEDLAARHRAYLERFCWALNRGCQKQVLPPSLRWLKAPGGQCYYWGELPAYARQEPIVQVEVAYREELFDGRVLLRLRDEVVLKLDLDPAAPPPERVHEPTPKQLDELLLSFAAGRLIRLPGLGGGFVEGDDGRVASAPR